MAGVEVAVFQRTPLQHFVKIRRDHWNLDEKNNRFSQHLRKIIVVALVMTPSNKLGLKYIKLIYDSQLRNAVTFTEAKEFVNRNLKLLQLKFN